MIKKKIFAGLQELRTRIICRRKINEIYANVSPTNPSKTSKKQYLTYWRRLQHKPSYRWAQVFEKTNNVHSLYYVPEDIYYSKIEPVLNFLPMAKCESCKAAYRVFYPALEFPKSFLYNINGVYYDEKYQIRQPNEIGAILEEISNYYHSMIIKPSLDSGGGKGVKKVDLNGDNWVTTDGEIVNLEYLSSQYGSDFLIQEYVKQHSFFARFNESSVNTVRILTYRSVVDERVHIVQAVLRVGIKGSITDNQASGGLSTGVDENGRLNEFFVDKFGNVFNRESYYPEVTETVIPFWDEIKKVALLLAKEVKYSRLLGLDLIVTSDNKVLLIEINNSSNEINFFQMNNGPLFKEFTDEIVAYCANNQRSYCFDFTV